MSIDEIMALADEYVSASIEDHGYRSGAASAEYLEDTKRKLLAALESLIAAPAAPVQQAEPVAWGQLGMMNGKTYLRQKYDREPYPPPPDVVRNLNLVPLWTNPPAAEVQRLREALKPFAAIDLTTNQAVDAMDVLRARRALEGGE